MNSAFRLTFLLMLATTSRLLSQVASAQQEVRYNRDVLPILAERCFNCHGSDKNHLQAGLRLDQSGTAFSILDSGARAIVPGDLNSSELWLRISSTDPDHLMPPSSFGKALTSTQQETLRSWIKQGAQYEQHWAYIPPAIANSRADGEDHSIDYFIRQRLANAGIEPAPEADRATLIRRVTLDLTGLPPSLLEVDAFLNDSRLDAYERVVDRLLQSEHFGERWARWWLDLAHYADSDGYLQDFIRPVAWRWRQWVVDAFNQDMPFDQFTIEQLAGDLLPNATVEQRMGTGFLRNTLSNREGGADLEEYRVNQVLDRTATVGTTWLALTIACAQCHDHKFDSLTQREYYQLYAFFDNADEANFDAPLPGQQEPRQAAKSDYDRQRAKLLEPTAKQLNELRLDWEKKLLYAESHPNEDFAWDRALELLGLQWGQNLGEGQLEGLNIIRTPLSLRSPDQQDRLLEYFLNSASSLYEQPWKELKLDELRLKLDALGKTLPVVTRAPGMMTFPTPRDTRIFIRGDFRRPGEQVAANTPAALPSLSNGKDRLALARWLVSPQNPLTARVVVNRLWQELFGRGIVASSDNFGVRGERPSLPELLDWLALDFMREGWRVKPLLRQIVLSKTYRQSSAARSDVAEIDPLNALLARQQRLRFSAESVRDVALAVSGLLVKTIGGPSVKPPQPASVSKDGYKNDWTPATGADRYRRGLYTWLQRTSPFAQSVTFDLPDSSRSCTRRERTNTPLQALNLLNDPVFLEAAQALANRVARECRGGDSARIDHTYMLALSRRPRVAERQRLLEFLEQQRAIFQADPNAGDKLLREQSMVTDPAWVSLASVILNLDEFITRE